MKRDLIETTTDDTKTNVKGGVWIIGEDRKLYWVDFDEGEDDFEWD